MHQVQLICNAPQGKKILQQFYKTLYYIFSYIFQAGQRKFPKETEEDKKEKVKARRDENLPVNGWGGLKLVSSYINGRLDEAADAVVLEPLDASPEEDAADVGDERPFGALAGRPANQVLQAVEKSDTMFYKSKTS